MYNVYLSEWIDFNHGCVLVEEQIVQIYQSLCYLSLFSRVNTELYSNILQYNKFLNLRNFYFSVS